MWFACGSNGTGSLGVGDAVDAFTLRAVLPSLRSARDVISGGRHTLFLGVDAAAPPSAYALGEGGCAGDGCTPRASPALLRAPQRIETAACGWEHALLLAADGFIFSVGAGGSGRLGLGSDAGAREPTEILLRDASRSGGGADGAADDSGGDGARATCVAAGGAHSLAVDTRGRVWVWGSARAAAGVAGAGPSRPPPILRPQLFDAANDLLGIPARGAARFSGDAAPGIDGGEVFAGVAAGWAFSVAWTSRGRVAAWGDDAWSQCGAGGEGRDGASASAAIAAAGMSVPTARASSRAPPAPPAWVGGLPHTITHVALGWSHAIALDSAGSVWAWGRNDLGQCGDGGAAPCVTAPARVALVCGCGGEDRGSDAPHHRARGVAAGAESGAAVLHCGCVCAWGWGEHGNLGGAALRVAAPQVAVVGRATGVRAAGASLWVRVDRPL
jgi:alpha-tubulin suppressor-like RCC1 family protein